MEKQTVLLTVLTALVEGMELGLVACPAETPRSAPRPRPRHTTQCTAKRTPCGRLGRLVVAGLGLAGRGDIAAQLSRILGREGQRNSAGYLAQSEAQHVHCSAR